MAIGALHALHEHGLRVPEDVAVVGFDDTDCAAYLTPSLTTVSQPFAELGRIALHRMLQMMDASEEMGPAPAPLAPRLVVRGSTRPEPSR